jgi:hypothetical protein
MGNEALAKEMDGAVQVKAIEVLVRRTEAPAKETSGC